MPSWALGGWSDVLLSYGWVVWLVLVFVLGSASGSLLNVCIARLPLEKSILWPSSRCGHCLQPIRWSDNIPLISYWLLRGRCRTCGQRFSVRYFFVELVTALGFAGLFYAEVVYNIHGWGVLKSRQADIAAGVIPWQGWVLFGHHAVLLSFLLVAAFCDLAHREIPLSLTVAGTLIGLAASVLWPWPFPIPAGPPPGPAAGKPAWWRSTQQSRFDPREESWSSLNIGREEGPRTGLYPWPVWGPLPPWLPPGSWQLGLATGLAGLLAGTLLIRLVRFLFGTGLGVEAIGLGDADLMMMAGSFLGWQPVVVAFFVSTLPGLLFGVVQLAVRRDNSLPFGPALAAGLVITWLAWERIIPPFQLFFFWHQVLLVLLVGSGLFMLVAGFFLRGTRRGAAKG